MKLCIKRKKNNKLTLIEYTCVFFNVLSKIFIFIYVKKALTKCAFVLNVRKFFYLKSYVTWFAFEYFVKQIILLKPNLNTRKHGLGHIVFYDSYHSCNTCNFSMKKGRGVFPRSYSFHKLAYYFRGQRRWKAVP